VLASQGSGRPAELTPASRRPKTHAIRLKEGLACAGVAFSGDFAVWSVRERSALHEWQQSFELSSTAIGTKEPNPRIHSLHIVRMDARASLVAAVRGWMIEAPSRALRLMPVLPHFQAKAMFSARAFLAMALAASFFLHPDLRTLLKPSILTPTAAVASMEKTLGATLMTSARFVAGAAVAVVYCSIVLTLFTPSLFTAIAATAAYAFVFSYLDLTVKTKRFLMSVVVVVLLQWWQPERDITPAAALQVGVGVLEGCLAGAIMSVVPLPAVPTAVREAGTRLRILHGHLRNALGALALAFTHDQPRVRARLRFHTVSQLFPSLSAAAQAAALEGGDDDNARERAESSTTLAAAPDPARGGGAHAAIVVSEEELAEDQVPLMVADVQDLWGLAREQLKAVSALLADMQTEPVPLLSAWLPVKHAAVGSTRAGCSERSLSATPVPLPPIGERITLWVKAHKRLLLIMQALIAAEQDVHASEIHSLFVRHLREPLSRLVTDVLALYAASIQWSVRLRLPATGDAGASASGSAATSQQGDAAGGGATRTVPWDGVCPLVGYPGEAFVSERHVVRCRQSVDASLASFFAAYNGARITAFYTRLSLLRTSPTPTPVGAAALRSPAALLAQRRGVGHAAEHAHAGGTDDGRDIELPYAPATPVGVSAASTPSEGMAHLGDAPGCSSPGPVEAALRGQARSGRDWNKWDALPLHAFLFFVLRFSQVVLSTVDAACPFSAPQGPAAQQPEHQKAESAAIRTDAALPPIVFSSAERVQARGVLTRPPKPQRFDWWAWLVAYLGLRLDRRQFRRALRSCIGITLACIAGVAMQEYVLGGTFCFWAPVTVAFINGRGVDVPTYTILRQRIVGTLIGTTFALFAVRLSLGEPLVIGLLASSWVAVMQFPFADGQIWARVAAFTAATISFASAGNTGTAHSLLEMRVLYTLLGIVVYLAVTQCIFPVSARGMSHDTLIKALTDTVASQRSILRTYIAFVQGEADNMKALERVSSTAAAAPRMAGGEVAAPFVVDVLAADPSQNLDAVGTSLAGLPDLLKEAEAEPVLWRTPFARLKPVYEGLSVQLQRMSRTVRGLFQVLLSLQSQVAMFEQRRAARAAEVGQYGFDVARHANPASGGAAGRGSTKLQSPTQFMRGSGMPAALMRAAVSPGVDAAATGVAYVSEPAVGSSGRLPLSIRAATGEQVRCTPVLTLTQSVHASSPSDGSPRHPIHAATSETDTERGILVVSALLPKVAAIAAALDRVFDLVFITLAEGPALIDLLPHREGAGGTGSIHNYSPAGVAAGDDATMRAAIHQRSLAAAALPAALEVLNTRLQEYVQSWDAFIRSYSIAVLNTTAAAGPSQSNAVVSPADVAAPCVCASAGALTDGSGAAAHPSVHFAPACQPDVAGTCALEEAGLFARGGEGSLQSRLLSRIGASQEHTNSLMQPGLAPVPLLPIPQQASPPSTTAEADTLCVPAAYAAPLQADNKLLPASSPTSSVPAPVAVVARGMPEVPPAPGPRSCGCSHAALPRPTMLSLSNVDALCFNTASFDLKELVRAASEIAAGARRLRRARDDMSMM